MTEIKELEFEVYYKTWDYVLWSGKYFKASVIPIIVM